MLAFTGVGFGQPSLTLDLSGRYSFELDCAGGVSSGVLDLRSPAIHSYVGRLAEEGRDGTAEVANGVESGNRTLSFEVRRGNGVETWSADILLDTAQNVAGSYEIRVRLRGIVEGPRGRSCSFSALRTGDVDAGREGPGPSAGQGPPSSGEPAPLLATEPLALEPLPLPPLGQHRITEGDFFQRSTEERRPPQEAARPSEGTSSAGERPAGAVSSDPARGAIEAVHAEFEPDCGNRHMKIRLEVSHTPTEGRWWADVYITGLVRELSPWDGIVWDERPRPVFGEFGWSVEVPVPRVLPASIRAELYHEPPGETRDELMDVKETTATRSAPNLRFQAALFSRPPNEYGAIVVHRARLLVQNHGDMDTVGPVQFRAAMKYAKWRSEKTAFYAKRSAPAYDWSHHLPAIPAGGSEEVTVDGAGIISKGADWRAGWMTVATLTAGNCLDADIRDNWISTGDPETPIRLKAPPHP